MAFGSLTGSRVDCSDCFYADLKEENRASVTNLLLEAVAPGVKAALHARSPNCVGWAHESFCHFVFRGDDAGWFGGGVCAGDGADDCGELFGEGAVAGFGKGVFDGGGVEGAGEVRAVFKAEV